MTDRELLELAAKAAGIAIDYSTTNGGGSHNTGFDVMGNAVLDWHNGVLWNPLAHDGDALRLAVKLDFRIDVDKDREWAAVMTPRNLGIDSILETNENGDPYAATRRAIVRAAAEIGKAMP
jgi:hypothetical protein